jgi:peptidyl-prolyl cis-trans isomerase B (cyclophilin B)
MAQVTLSTNHGDIVLSIDEVGAPNTAKNFLKYVREGHYDGTIFHRVIKDFMIQGGGFEPGMKQKAVGAPIEHEGQLSSAAGLKNTRGTVAMARTNDPHSATAQFFINTVDNDFLNYRNPTAQGFGYVVFGHVTAGMDVVEKIREVPTGQAGFHGDVPKQDVMIQKAIVA